MAAPSAGSIRERVLSCRHEAERLFAELDEGSRRDPGIVRDTYGPSENFAHRLVANHESGMGLRVERDHVANTYMTLPEGDGDAPRLVVGSHLDSVPHGGNFDGAAGVVAGLIACRMLADLDGPRAPDLTVMAIRAEESVWFEVSYIGSRAALGTLPPDALLKSRIDTGRTLADHMAECGADPEAIRNGRRALDPARIGAFVELHIEQAPSLVEAGKPIAIRTGIPGNFRFANARILGSNGHVGTPRRFQRDAAMAASRFATALDAIWQEHEDAGVPIAVTLGRFHANPKVHGLTTVPGEFDFSVDVRAYDQAVLDELERKLHEVVARVKAECRVAFRLGERASAPVASMSSDLRDALTRGAAEIGIPAMSLGSPASHDAAAFAAAGVPTGMIFVRNENGSHNPAESMAIGDFLDGTAVLTHWLAEAAAGDLGHPIGPRRRGRGRSHRRPRRHSPSGRGCRGEGRRPRSRSRRARRANPRGADAAGPRTPARRTGAPGGRSRPA